MLIRRLGLGLVLLAVGALPAEAAVLTLNWQDNANNEDGYIIERADSGPLGYQRIALVPGNTIAYPDGSVVQGQPYCYRVQAFNGGGVSGYSAPACGVAGPGDSPATPRFEVQLERDVFRTGETLVLTATLTSGVPALVDAYVVARLPDGSLLSLESDGEVVPDLAPFEARIALAPGALHVPLDSVILQYTFTGAELPGPYALLVGLTWTGTTELVGPPLVEVPFYFAR